MSLTIALDKPGNQVYCPGSTVSGRVQLSSEEDEAIASIDLRFTGRCKVKIRKHDHYTTVSYRSRGYYFSQHLSLYAEGKYKHKSGTYSWPFTLTIPEHASQRPVSGNTMPIRTPSAWRPARQLTSTGVLQPGVGHELDNDTFGIRPPFRASVLNALQPHPLPESFSYSNGGFPADFEGRIEYTLVATLTRPSGSLLFSPKNLEASAPIVLKPYRPSSTQDLVKTVQKRESTHFISTPRLLPSNVDRRLTLLDRTKNVFNPSSIPSAAFKVTIAAPHYLAPAHDPKDAFPFILAVSRSSIPTQKDFETTRITAVKLSAFQLWVRARTLLRDNGKAAVEQFVDYEDRIFLNQQHRLDIEVPVRRDGDESPSKIGEVSHRPSGLNLARILDLRLKPDLLPPDFSTYNIYRSYTMGFRLKLECLGESVEVIDDRIKVRVLPELSPHLPYSTYPSLGIPTPPLTPSLEEDARDAKNTSGPPELLPRPPYAEDELPEYQHHAPEGPLPPFHQ